MASIVDTSVKHFYNSMRGAPVLNGVAGSLIALLDACLVTGWGLKAVDSASVSAGVCRLNFASGKSAAEADTVIVLSGATPAGLNGEQKVTAISSTWVEFATALPDGAVTGSLSFKMAPAGWTKAFTGTNLAAYQSPNAQSTKMFVRVDDTNTTSCRLRGYETMTDINSGGGLFPLDSQIVGAAGGGWMNKSDSADTRPVNWRIVANSRAVYISVVGSSSSADRYEAGRTIFIGDFQAAKPSGDAYAFAIGCAPTDSFSEIGGTCDQAGSTYQFAPRSFSGLGSSIGLDSRAEVGQNTTSGLDNFFGSFPSVIDGGLRLSRRLMLQSAVVRGVLPGLYTVPQTGVGLSIAPLTKIAGEDALAGRKLLAIGCGATRAPYPSASLGISFIDVTGPWGF